MRIDRSLAGVRRRSFPAALLTLALLGAGTDAAHAAATATLTPTTTFAAGTRQVNGGPGTARTYTLTSTGTDALAVTSVALQGADAAQFTVLTDTCTARDAANPLTQGQTCTVAVAFAPTLTGSRSTTLRIQTAGPTLTTAAITGTGRDLRPSVPSVAFGAVHVGDSSTPVPVTFTNADTAAHPLGAITATSTVAITDNTCATGTPAVAITLAPGASCGLTLTYKPTEQAVLAGTVTMSGLGPALVTLTGTGVEPAAAATPALHDFATREVAAGASPASVFTVRNTGTAALHPSDATLAGIDAGAFAITADTCGGATVAAGATCTVSAAFAPTAGGWRMATLTVPSDAGGPPLAIRLTGRATGAAGPDSDPLGRFELAAQPVVRLQGDSGDTVGSGLGAQPCDVNDDGYDDILSGAPTWSTRPVDRTWEGAVYVTFGGRSIGSADLGGVTPSQTLRIEGAGGNSQTGLAVDCAGDVNADGIDDIVLGSWGYEYPGRPTGTAAPRGRAYVVFGATDLPTAGPLDTSLMGDRGYTISAPAADEYDHFGYAVAGMGDVTGDGRADVAIMANTGDSTTFTPPRSNNGLSFLIPGQASTADVDAATAKILTINGGTTGQGNDVANVGDVDGDGVDDIGTSSITAVYAGRSTASGMAFVTSGTARGSVDLQDTSQTLMTVGGAFAGQRLGTSIDAAGDVNGDGAGDLVIGSDATAAANSDNAYVVFGRTGAGADVVDTATLGDRGYRILGEPGKSTGYAVAGIGDVDGDASDDALVGGYGSDAGGAAWIVYGQPDPTALPANDAASGLVPANAADTTRYVKLATLTAAQGSRLLAATAGERFGRQVAAVGDVDGNGAGDIAIGSDQAFRLGRATAGEVSVALLPGSAPAAPPVLENPGPTTTGPGTTTTPAPATTSTAPPAAGGAAAPSRRRRAPLPTVTARIGRLDSRGGVTFGISCGPGTGACRGRVALRLAGVRRQPLTFRIRAGGRTRVRLVLTPAQRRTLQRHGSLAASLTIGATGATGGTVWRTLRVIVRAPRSAR